MTDEAKLDADISAAFQARHELERTADAFALLRAEYVKAWEATSARDSDARERLWQAVQIVGKVEGHLKSVVANGRLAERELAQIRGRKPIFTLS